MKRRTFLQTSSAVAAGAVAAPYILKGKNLVNYLPNQSFGFDDNDNVLIMIQLYGGNDGLNTIIPITNNTSETAYMDLRPNIAISRDHAVQWGNKPLYLHPALVNPEGMPDGPGGPDGPKGFIHLLNQGRLGVIEGIGYPNPNLSHFRSRDFWQSGIVTDDPNEKILDGWIGRFLASKMNDPGEITEHPLAISIGGTIPLAFKAAQGSMGVAVLDPVSFFERGNGLKPSDGLITDPQSNYDNEYNFVNTIAQQTEKYSVEVKKAFDKGMENDNLTYPDVANGNSIGDGLRTIARLIDGGLKTKVYNLVLSNFDTHVQQLNKPEVGQPLDGQHPDLLANVARGVTTFMEDVTNRGISERIVGYTFSEFGRRAYDNGSRGSDHGTTSNLFVFGHNENVDAPIGGEPPDLLALKNGNLDFIEGTNMDFRSLYTEVLQDWFGASRNEAEVILKGDFQPAGAINQRITSVKEYLDPSENGFLNVYPNPNRGRGFIGFNLTRTAKVEIQIHSLDGRASMKLFKGILNPGEQNQEFTIDYSGFYNVIVLIEGQKYTAKINVTK